jgi:hypothetical protein
MFPRMTHPSDPAPTTPFSADALLQQFAANTMAVDGLVVEMCAAERALMAAVAQKALQTKADTTDLALQLAGPRAQALVRAHERLGRSLRLTLALRQRIAAGWPKPRADDSRSMKRRQVERALRDRVGDGEEREQLLAEINERLTEPDIEAMLDSQPVEEVIEAIGRELQAVRQEVQAIPPAPAEAADPWAGPDPDEAGLSAAPPPEAAPPRTEPAPPRTEPAPPRTEEERQAVWRRRDAAEGWSKRFKDRHGFLPEDIPLMRPGDVYKRKLE